MDIAYTERTEGESLFACIDLADGGYMEVPIHGVTAENIQPKLQEALDLHNQFMAAFSES